MRIIGLLLFAALSGCINASEISKPVECDFEFAAPKVCSYKNIKVKLQVKFIEEDEVSVTGITVTLNNKNQTLKMHDDFTFLKGETGYILFDDINFDGKTDLAVTTSFGTPNLYLNYWVLDPATNKFKFVGNYCKLAIDKKTKTLSNTEKISATNYKNNHYFWKKGVLTSK